MAISTDMLNVRDGEAVVVRHWDLAGRPFTAVIDGGYASDGPQLVSLLKSQYGADHVDLVVATHPDQDHISGLTHLLQQIRVDNVWVHDPELHQRSIEALRHTVALYQRLNIDRMLTKSVDDLREFMYTVKALGIPTTEPFDGLNMGPLWVLGPSRSFYEQKLAEMSGTGYFVKELMRSAELDEDRDAAIDDNNDTSPINDTSTILYLADSVNGGVYKYLFTGDAGVDALYDAAARYDFSNLEWLDVPHHGSRRNLNTGLIEWMNPRVAYISADGSAKHPGRATVRALKSQGTIVYSTHQAQGSMWRTHAAPMPLRFDYGPMQPL